MSRQKLVSLLQAGYPQFKEHSGVPSWLLPERSFAVVVDGLGDTRMMEMSRCLGLLPDTVEEIPDGDVLPQGMWQEACLAWSCLSLVSETITALLESADRVMAKHNRGDLNTEPQAVFRSLMAIAFAPLVRQGKAVLHDVAVILGGAVDDPADMITRYADAVLSDDPATVTRVVECIGSHREWACWADMLQQLASSFPEDYRMVAVTPQLSEGLVDALADMMKETAHYGA